MTAVRLSVAIARPLRWVGCVLLAATASAASAETTTTTTAPSNRGPHFGQPGSPVDITANNSAVNQNEQKIVYEGNVEAVQGTTRLRTPRLTMWYNNKNAVKPAPGAAPANSGAGAIERMEADGPVFFVTPTQSARGDHGFYNAAEDTITLAGNVVLTQDKNVSSGDKLVIHQKDGTATLSSEKASGRVRGVFYNEDKGKAAPGAPPASGPAAVR